MILVFDTETDRFAPAWMAPPLVCVQWCTLDRMTDTLRNPPQIINHWHALDWTRWALEQELIVGHNIFYDLAVLAAHCLTFGVDIVPSITRALAENRITDTKVRQQLADIGRGQYRGFASAKGWVQLNYDLGDVSKRHAKHVARAHLRCEPAEAVADKDDPWRLNYGLLREIPVEQWGERIFENVPVELDRGKTGRFELRTLHGQDALTYALKDPLATAAAYVGQETRDEYSPALLVDQYQQCRKFWGLHLIATWGLRTSETGVRSLREGTEEALAELEAFLIEQGLVRPNGVKNTKVARARMAEVCEEIGIEPRMSDPSERFPEGQISLDSDACATSLDPLLKAYADYSSLKKVLSNDVKIWTQGITHPIHTHFDIADTGRVTATKGVQNPRRLPGVRECIVPRGYRDGMYAGLPTDREALVLCGTEGGARRIFFSADYDGLELRTMAQMAINLVGYSRLADALNAGRDPHLEMAATLMHLPYPEVKTRHEAGDKATDLRRQSGKIGNFGFGGAMGPEKFVLQARRQYKVRMTEDEVIELKEAWYRTWPEMYDVHELFRSICDAANGPYQKRRKGEKVRGKAVFQHFYSQRLRGGLNYTQYCNGPFQGLGADATGNALWLVLRACYELTPCAACDGASNGCEWCRPCHGPGISPMYGARIVNYVHDEFIGECCEAWGHEVAHELVRLMVRGAAPYLPNVPATAKPQLMRFWSKGARPITMPCGPGGAPRLVPWEYGYDLGRNATILGSPEKWFPREKREAA